MWGLSYTKYTTRGLIWGHNIHQIPNTNLKYERVIKRVSANSIYSIYYNYTIIYTKFWAQI